MTGLVGNAATQLNKIVDKYHGSRKSTFGRSSIHDGSRYHFTRALFLRLHAMRVDVIAELAKPEGIDAIDAIAMALASEDWRALAETTSHTLPRTLEKFLIHIGGATPVVDRSWIDQPHRQFTNNIRVKTERK